MYPHYCASQTERRAPLRRGSTFFIYSLRDCSLIAYRARSEIHLSPRYKTQHTQTMSTYTIVPDIDVPAGYELYWIPSCCARIIYLIFTVHLFCARASDCTFTWPVVRRPTRFFVWSWFRCRCTEHLVDDPSILDSSPPFAVANRVRKKKPRSVWCSPSVAGAVGFSSRPVFA